MPPSAKPSYQLIIGDQAFHIDHPTYNFRDADPGYDGTFLGRTKHAGAAYGAGPGLPAYAPAKGLEGKVQRYRLRHLSEKKRSPALAKAIIRQFVIHLDGCLDAEMCFNVLHNERGLSCHFILDNDGIIYQTLDLLDCAYHASGMNETSIGIEICNRGDAKRFPDTYNGAPKNLQREKVVCSINNDKYIAFDYTELQYKGMIALSKALARLLPGIKLDYPRTAGGDQRWDTLEPGDPTNVHLRESFSGYLGHYHVTNQKWDPGPFDFRRHISKLSGHRTFPIGLHKLADKVEVPDAPAAQTKAYEDVFEAYYNNNEIEGSGGGYFPVGPLEEKPRLWHGGLHLHADKGTKVYASFPGLLRLARNGPVTSKVGSTNFVLLSHSLKVSGEDLSFFSLYYHLDEEKRTGKKEDRPKWWGNLKWQEGEPGKTVSLDDGEPVQGGEMIGRVGVAGVDPPEPQLHWEIFSADSRAVTKVDAKSRFWTTISGASDQRFCTASEIMEKIDKKPKDGVFSTDELLAAYRDDYDYRVWSRQIIASHYSEWSVYPDWEVALKGSPEYAKHPRDATTDYHEQIEPGLWMTDTIARGLGLSTTVPIYTYQPISFLKWLNGLLRQSDESTVKKATKDDFATANGKAMTDFDDKEGLANLEQNERSGKVLQPIDLSDMVDGYGD
jgi:murein DD-endopeptidase MepM/ murein hydrolase activator NlpD